MQVSKTKLIAGQYPRALGFQNDELLQKLPTGLNCKLHISCLQLQGLQDASLLIKSASMLRRTPPESTMQGGHQPYDLLPPLGGVGGFCLPCAAHEDNPPEQGGCLHPGRRPEAPRYRLCCSDGGPAHECSNSLLQQTWMPNNSQKIWPWLSAIIMP